jgi:cob(I)alamin adenosyltransferase
MSIATRTGDQGETGLMYNKRVSKACPRVEAYGTVDELNAFLGAARAHAQEVQLREYLLVIQRDLVLLMGELAVDVADSERYAQAYPLLESKALERLDALVAEIEAQSIRFEGWATPGATVGAAHLDVARTVVRRAERRLVALAESAPVRPLLVKYLNRLADVLWLMARREETRHASPNPGPTTL